MRLIDVPRRGVDAFKFHWSKGCKALAIIALVSLTAHVASSGTHSAQAASSKATTSFIVGLAKKVNYRAYALSNPNRVIVDLPAMAIDLPVAKSYKNSPIIDRVDYGLLIKGKARLIIHTKRPVRVVAKYTKTATGKGADLTLAITPRTGKTKSFKRIRSSLGGPAKSVFANNDKPLIVIDAGHGGHDTGAIRHGIREKDMVLAFAKILRTRLTKTGRYRVIMTRDTDKFIKLRRRAQIARQHRADLFISVHADYVSPKYSHVRGATFYTLKGSTAKRLARSGRKGIKVSNLVKGKGKVTGGVASILSDLEARWINGTKTRSDIFADSLRAYMGDATKLKRDPHRTANFAVLKSASVPSVLIELAYVSNKKDAALLKSSKWRNKATTALTKAVDNYFGDNTVRLPF